MSPTLKYSIKDKLQELPQKAYSQALLDISEILGISKDHLYRIINIPLESTSYINSHQLLQIAEYLGCSMDSLINQESFDAIKKATA